MRIRGEVNSPLRYRRRLDIMPVGFVSTRLLDSRDSCRQFQRANRNRVVLQRREADFWRWMECFHDLPREVGFNGGTQWLAHVRKSAADDDDLGMDQMNDMRQSECDSRAQFFDHSAGQRLTPGKQRRQMPRLAASRSRDAVSQHRVGVFPGKRPKPGVDRPSGTGVFNSKASGIKADVPELHFTGRRTVKNLSADHQAASHATAEVRIEDRVKPRSGTVNCLCQGREIGIVFRDCRAVSQVGNPVSDWKAIPPCDLMRANDAACAGIDRSAKPNRYRSRAFTTKDLGKTRGNLALNGWPARAVCVGAPSPNNLRRRIRQHNLQLGAANLDSCKPVQRNSANGRKFFLIVGLRARPYSSRVSTDGEGPASCRKVLSLS